MSCRARQFVIVAALICSALLPSPALSAGAARTIVVDAGALAGKIRSLQGVAGFPGPGLTGRTRTLPDVSGIWRAAGVDFVRSYDWRARLDTADSAESLFPHWAADPDDPSSYNFAAADQWVASVRALGAEVMFTIASEIPSSSLPPADLGLYERVVRHIVEHYTHGWANGMNNAVRYWEFSDQPDFHQTHFAGTPGQFYAMYAAVARAVKSVGSELQVGGPNLAFPLNDDAPYREGFLDYVRRENVPLDFFSWIWFSDTSYDPLDFNRVAEVVRQQLEAHGLGATPQVLASFNMTAIPTAKPDPVQAAAFQVAALTYLQDAPVERVVLFRADNGLDPNYGMIDPDHMFGADGAPDARAHAFVLNGRMQFAAERLRVDGGDDRGFAVLAGRNHGGDLVQVLVANYAIPPEYLKPGKPRLEFTIPVGPDRARISFKLLERRVAAVAAAGDGYDIKVEHLPWGRQPFSITRHRVDAGHDGRPESAGKGRGGSARFRSDARQPSVELFELRPIH